MPTSGCRTDTIHAGSSYTLLDPGGDANYPATCSSVLTLVSDSGTAITISGMLRTDYSYASLRVYESTTDNVPISATYSGLQNVNITLPSGVVTLVFNSSNATTYYGFQFAVTVCDLPEGIIRNVTIDSVTPNSATVYWDNNGSNGNWTVRYGTAPSNLSNTITCTEPTAILTALSPNTTYYYTVSTSDDANNTCGSIVRKIQTTCVEPRGNCIDYSNLTSCYVRATYGTFFDPIQHCGIVDSGSSSIHSRHTVHTDTAETDPRSGNKLHTVPPGYTSSVRLGNWDVYQEAESITYDYTVDTNASDLLIMKYAALLQVPNHNSIQRPRFKFQILDENDCEVNSSCYSADFVASTELGWNIYDPLCFDSVHLTTDAVLWKDWTTVGIDLTPLHGQTIKIRLSTYDCAHGQHYGYAYFVIDCSNKTLLTENCGCQIENTFTAPEGFSYQWYNTDAPSEILSTNQSLHVTQAGEYHCRISFIGAPAGTSCSFEMQAIAGERYPAAIIAFDSSRTENCNMRLNLHNNSCIATDSLRQNLTSRPCEQGEWFVDSQFLSTSTDESIILSPGDHTIQLVASLSGGGCTDTATWSIHVADLNTQAYIHDTIVQNQLPYIFLDSTFTDGTLNSHFSTLNHLGCDSTIYYTLQVWHNVQTMLNSTICDTQLPLLWNGHLFSDTPDAIQGGISQFYYHFTIPNIHGADSTVYMTLHVLPSSDTTIHDTIVQNQLPYTFLDSTFTDETFNTQFSILNYLGCDSTINYTLHVWHNVQTSLDSTICDTQLPLLWNGHLFSDAPDTLEDGILLFNHHFTIPNNHGADSTIYMTLHVLPSSDTTINDTIVQNQLPYTFHDSTFTDGTFNSQFSTLNYLGCDSTIHYTLHVWNNVFTTIDSTICADQLPFTWHDTIVTDIHSGSGGAILQSGSQSSTHTFQYITTNVHGADSTVTLNLTIYPVYDLYFYDTLCDNQLPYIWNDHTFSGDSTSFNYHLSTHTSFGCDSTVHLFLSVNPTHHTNLYDTICDNLLPYTWDGHTFDSSNFSHQFSTYNSYGCDSTITMLLTVHPTNHTFHRAVVCDGAPYHWIDGNTYTNSTYSPHIDYLNIYGCDSVLHLLLDLDNNFEATMEIAPTMVDLDHPEVRLRDRSESHSRIWFISEPTLFSSGIASPIFVDTARISTFMFPADQDSLQVLLVARTMAGCIDSVWGMVHCNRAVIWAPTAITPDEPQNNRFAIISNQLANGEVWIYNRAGLLITHFDALTGSWDGTYHGSPCPQATYTWIMKYATLLQPRQTRTTKGTVTIIR